MSKVRAAIYARVSSKAQRDKHTIDGQLRVLNGHAAVHGLEIVGPFLDDGRSVKTGMGLDDRAGFNAMIVAAERRLFDVVLVVSVDRLTRTEDILEQAEVLSPFQRLGIKIVTPTGELDLSTMFGRMWTVMEAYRGAEENVVRSQRIKAGKLRAIANNRKPAGPTPFGLKYDKATGDWSLDEEAAAMLREMIQRVGAGETCVQVADDFIRRGLRAPGRGQAWTRSTVYRLIHNRYSCGVWVVNKKKNSTIQVPRIVSDEDWNAAQVALRRAQRAGLNRSKHVYLLQSLAKCGHCGAPILIRSGVKYFNAARQEREHPAAYICRSRMAKPRTCHEPIVYTRELDDRVWAALSERLDSPDLVRELANVEADRAGDARDWGADAAGYRAHLERLTKVETTLTMHYRTGRLTEEVYASELEAVLRERRMVRDQLATAEHAAGASFTSQQRLKHARLSLDALRAALPKATPEQRQALLRELVRDGGVVITAGRAHLDLRLVRRAEAKSRGASVGGPIGVVTTPDYRSAPVMTLQLRLVA